MQQIHYLIIEDDKGVRGWTLNASTYSIGRAPKCDICLISQFVSRHSATLIQQLCEDGSSYYQIIDGNLEGKPSINGLLINGHKLQAHDLKDRDEVVFGPQVRSFYFIREKEDGLPEKCDFLFQCSKTWNGLRETSNPKVRYCSECQQEVYRVRVDFDDLKKQLSVQQCFVLDFDPEIECILRLPTINNDSLKHGED